MPAYNVSQYIREALDSVFAQTFSDFEVIVINDGSPDTLELEKALEPYRESIVYVKHSNRGLAGARNTGLGIAKGEFVALLDPDDAWFPEYLSVQLETIESDPSVDVVYPDAVIFGGTPDAGKRLMEFSPSNGPVTVESLVTQRCTVMVSVVGRKAAFIKAGLFDSSLRSSEDFDLWLRLLKSGGKIAYHRNVLVRYRKRPDSLSANPIWMNEHILKVLEKCLLQQVLSLDEASAVRRAIRKFRADLDLCEAKVALRDGKPDNAIQKLERANTVLRKRKISVFLPLLKTAPNLICRVYRMFNHRFSQ
jgi:glycosyltransferase involved in cell wall biosynthesis